MESDRPRGVDETTWALVTLNTLAYWTIMPGTPGLVAAQVILISVGYLGLWFYWKGRNWSRWLVMIWSVVAIWTLQDWHRWSGLAVHGMITVDAILGCFLLYWLNTKAVRQYFRESKPATHA
jgi:hypothetical protein